MRVLKKELWPCKVELNLDQTQSKITEVETWLGQQLGSFKDQWNAVYHWDHTVFYFRRGEDATMFALKWS